MEVILIKPVRQLGRIGEIHEVRNGFAWHYLFPRKLAVRATEDNKQLIERQKHKLEEKEEKIKISAAETGDNIRDKEIIFIKQSADDGRLFGSVSSKEIAESLSKIVGHQISYASIILDKPIKTTGLFTVEVRLHAELSTDIAVIVARTELEAHSYSRDNKQNVEEVEILAQ
ncbi:50S ribosomal protein L9 [Pseudolycoriella hygida]|uniref:Large ribosomal subunit protein bL9m n=1 Tax=Pseudolycoriella hygida TaxID=35572 RepID=A0A9Q0RSU4_9DIPT|nr:50S ribosomal protein L9 [Pseudolycoriella hygida]KAJ6645027.1 50S ribosomal protein L9 [Pseudolycoriella hygida]